jgi:hypothetical protein
MAVRVLALLSAVLVVLTMLEARTIRDLRAELQVARAERDELRARVASMPQPCQE